jgi:hypothetical protein
LPTKVRAFRQIAKKTFIKMQQTPEKAKKRSRQGIRGNWQKPAREQGRNTQLEQSALARARASAGFYSILNQFRNELII